MLTTSRGNSPSELEPMRRGALLSLSSPHKRRVLRLQPLPAVSAPIAAARALRHDPLQTQLEPLGPSRQTRRSARGILTWSGDSQMGGSLPPSDGATGPRASPSARRFNDADDVPQRSAK